MIEESFTDNYNTSKLDNGEDEIIKTEKMTVTFTTTENQKKNKNNNMSTIDLGDCEYLLKNKYNISINETLYMKKIDIVQEEMTTTKVEYDVYCKLSGSNLIKLNFIFKIFCNGISPISIILLIKEKFQLKLMKI